MIVGSVNAYKQAVVSLVLYGPTGLTEFVDAVIDTGYSVQLTVTPMIAARLQLPFFDIRTYGLGSGEPVDFPVHDAAINWDGVKLEITTLVTDGGVLVGMSMLEGFTLFIDAVDGGEVRIQARV